MGQVNNEIQGHYVLASGRNRRLTLISASVICGSRNEWAQWVGERLARWKPNLPARLPRRSVISENQFEGGEPSRVVRRLGVGGYSGRRSCS